MNVLIYQLSGLPVSVVRPLDTSAPIVEEGTKVVPLGVPFWVVSEDFLPTDRAYRNAWVLDVTTMGSHDGIGSKVDD